jgi:hypothetical protein
MRAQTFLAPTPVATTTIKEEIGVKFVFVVFSSPL